MKLGLVIERRTPSTEKPLRIISDSRMSKGRSSHPETKSLDRMILLKIKKTEPVNAARPERSSMKENRR